LQGADGDFVGVHAICEVLAVAAHLQGIIRVYLARSPS
jgi:hypothetical protein